jgi:hypothetical protein
MNDLERWINLQGPPPPHIRALFDAGRELRGTRAPPATTPELWDDLDRRVFADIAADRRHEASRRAAKTTLKVVAGLGLLAAGVAGALLLGDVLHRAAPLSIVAKEPASGELAPVLGANVATIPPSAPSTPAKPSLRPGPPR